MTQYLKWKPSSSKLYGHPCIEFVYPDTRFARGYTEYALASKRGEIYAFNDELATILCLNPKVAKLVAGELQVRDFQGISEGDEVTFKAPISLVPKMIEILKIPKTRPAQARMANAYGKDNRAKN